MAKRKPAKKATYRSPHHASQDRIFQSTNVYLMTNLPYFWLNKFGIGDHTKSRAKNVSDTTPGAVDTIIDASIPYGKTCETFVHGFYFALRKPFDKGSGRTEWFVIFSPVVGGLTVWITGALKIKLHLLIYAACFFCPGIWLDGLFWMMVFWALGNFFKAAQIALIVAAVMAALYLYTQTYPK